MKLAVFTPVFLPYKGGIGRVAANEAQGLKELGCEVDIFTPQYKGAWPKEESWRGIRIFRLKTKIKFGNTAWIKTHGAQLENYDVLHLHYPFIGGARSVLKWKKQKQKLLVVTYHMDLVAGGWRGILFKIYSRFVLPKIVAAADKIILSSRDYGEHSFLAKYLEKQPAKFTVIPFGVKVKDLSITKAEAKKQLNLERLGRIVLFVGALDKAHYFKGLEVLFKALREAKRSKLNFNVVIVGDGELKGYYQKIASQMGVDDRIIFAGKISDENLQKYYQVGDVLVLPSIGPSEAYGMVIIEAAIQGLPAIVSNLPGVREQAGEDRGMMFKVKDEKDLAGKIISILENDGLREQMGLKAREWAENNRSLKQEAESLLSVYKTVAKV